MGWKSCEENKVKKICYVVTLAVTIKAFFVEQLNYLAENGIEVSVICSDDSTLNKVLDKRIKYIPLDIPRGVSVIGSIKAIKKLVKIFENEKYDLVQYSTPNASFYASWAAMKCGIKIRNYHLMGLRYLGAKGLSRFVLKMIEKITCNNSTSIECVSRSNLKLALEEGLFSEDKGSVIWNGSTGGVQVDRFDFLQREKWRTDIRKENNIEENDFLFGFVGRITRDKGINEILRAFLEIEEECKLILVGCIESNNKISDSLMEQALKNENIIFHDSVDDIQRYYAAMDVILLPSYREGFGNVIIEAAAVGTPAIVSNIPGPIDAIEVGKTAYTVIAKDSINLRQQMIKIMKSDYWAMGKSACEFVKNNFDSVILCEKILEHKIKLLKGESD